MRISDWSSDVCSSDLTWVWRVAHNRATSHMLANKRHAQRGWASIEDVEIADADATPFERADSDRAMALILSIIDRLDPPDRQILLLYLEGVAGAEIGAVTGDRKSTRLNSSH